MIVWFVSLRTTIGVPSCCSTVEQMLYMPYGHSIQPARNALVGIMLIVIVNKADNAMSTIMNVVMQWRRVSFVLLLGRMY